MRSRSTSLVLLGRGATWGPILIGIYGLGLAEARSSAGEPAKESTKESEAMEANAEATEGSLAGGSAPGGSQTSGSAHKDASAATPAKTRLRRTPTPLPPSRRRQRARVGSTLSPSRRRSNGRPASGMGESPLSSRTLILRRFCIWALEGGARFSSAHAAVASTRGQLALNASWPRHRLQAASYFLSEASASFRCLMASSMDLIASALWPP